MNGRQEQLKLLLNQGDPAQLGRMMAYYGYLSRARAARITAISEHLAHLELLTENIAAETDKLRTLEQENARDVEALADARARRARTLVEVQSRIKTRNEQLTKLQRDAHALEKLIEELRRAIEEFPELDEQPFQRIKGKLPWPVKGSVLARFGQLRSGGPLKWQGIVIGAQRGSQVRAPYHGRVVYADWLPGLGTACRSRPWRGLHDPLRPQRTALSASWGSRCAGRSPCGRGRRRRRRPARSVP